MLVPDVDTKELEALDLLHYSLIDMDRACSSLYFL
jgi:hypothetical protein